MRYRLRTLFLAFAVTAVFLSGAVPFVRWMNSRPGIEITKRSHWPVELNEIAKRVGQDKLQDLQIWHLYGGWFGFDHVWKAKVSPEAVKSLQDVARMNAIHLGQVPNQFWNMPPEWSDMPGWWNPQPVDGAEYYMSPTFVPRSVINENLDCVAMYDPDRQMLYVWSQWDF